MGEITSFAASSVFLLATACADTAQPVDEASVSNPHDSPESYFNSAEAVLVDVYYEPMAEPFTSTLQNGNPLWSITEMNLEAVFDSREVPVSVPSELEEMTAIPAQNRTSFTSEDILFIYEDFAEQVSDEDHAVFFVVFLDGYFEQDGQAQTSVIGVNLSGSGIIAMFKPVIESTRIGLSNIVPAFVEQSTLVHELGHALGLVNNGIPMQNDHHDAEHGAHCTNEDCVMYYLNEGAADLRDYAGQVQATGDFTLFKENCLEDASSF